jgi:glycosyltransferase involved in cell wall biosynthesis
VGDDLARCDGLIASSRYSRDRVLEHPGPWPPAAVVHPSADLIAADRPPAPLPPAPRLLTLARMVRQERYKGHRLVLGALEILRTRGLLPTGLLWLVVGDGDDRQALEQLALGSDIAAKWLEGKAPSRVIVVPGKLVNLVP